MLIGDFVEKLKKLNPRIWVDRENITYDTNPETGSCGIYYREDYAKPFDISALSGADFSKASQLFMRPMIYVDWVTQHVVPEFNRYIPQQTKRIHDGPKLVAQGWREILLRLHRKGYFPLERARKIFRCSSLGESTWEHLSFDEKAKRFLRDA